MKNSNNSLKVLVATSSAIIRSGLSSVLKRIHEMNIQPVEINSVEALNNYVQVQKPDILMIDPTFGGWFDIAEFKATDSGLSSLKCIAIIASMIDSTQMKDYQETIAIYDSIETITDKLRQLMKSEEEEKESDTEALSQREKEIITLVVKGLTNKEIADQLCLSIHTVITHRRNIARKLQIHSPAGLTIYAIVNKLVELKDVER
ncbi:MAG: response regulator transcription factor [Bacteroidaceae bacterium]|nr:response regulator transcription factor [Bacteroidaceae bacterium]